MAFRPTACSTIHSNSGWTYLYACSQNLISRGALPGAYSFRGPGAVQTTKYVEGQISIDFFAESTKSLAWQINDSGKLEEMSGEELRQAVKELMTNLLAGFPPEG